MRVGGEGVGQGRPGGRHSPRVEDIDVRIRAAEQLRIDGEEEAARLELEILDLAIDRLEGAVADGENPVANDVALLLGENRLDPHRSDLGDGLQTVVAAGDSRG